MINTQQCATHLLSGIAGRVYGRDLQLVQSVTDCLYVYSDNSATFLFNLPRGMWHYLLYWTSGHELWDWLLTEGSLTADD